MNLPEQSGRFWERWQACLMLLWLGLLTLVAARSVTPPLPWPANAPPANFSAARALVPLREIATRPHPQGSPEHGRVRDYLMAQLRQLGLSPQLQTTPVVSARTSRPYRAATVHNIWARVAGSHPTGTLLLAAHYDSVSTGPGASDDGASVAALLETLRALQSHNDTVAANPVSFQKASADTPFHLRNDLIILLTDGEETGLLGARAFVEGEEGIRDKGKGISKGKTEDRRQKTEDSPLSTINYQLSTPTLVLNFEARGTSGPSLMFETSAGNGWLARQFAQAVPQPLGSSLFYAVYKRLPNDTDFTEFRDAGMIGLNFAYIDRAVHYHTSLDSVARLDLRSLQHHGDTMLSLARQFGNAALTEARQPDAIYFNVTRAWLCVYPATWAVPLALLATLLTALVLRQWWQGNKLIQDNGRSGRQISVALLSGMVWVGLGVGGTVLMLAGLTYWLTSGAATPRMTLYLDKTTLTGVVLLTMGSVLLLSDHKGSARKRENEPTRKSETASARKRKNESAVGGAETTLSGSTQDAMLMGAMLWWLMLTWLTTLLLPEGSYLFVWPLLGVLPARGVQSVLRKRQREDVKGAWSEFTCLILGAMPAVLLVMPVLILLFTTLSIGSLTIIGALTALAVALLRPQLVYAGRVVPGHPQALPLLLTAIGACLLWVDAEALQPSETHPRANSIFYALNADTNAAIWAGNDRKPDAWTTQFLGENPKRATLPDFLPVSPETFLQAPAPDVLLPAPIAILQADRVENGVRELDLRVHSPRHAPMIEIATLPDVQVLGATVEGKPVGGNNGLNHAWSLLYFNAPDEGLTLQLRVQSTAPVSLHVIDRSYGLPAIPDKVYAPRPATMIASPASGWYQDTTLVAKTFRF